MSRYASQLGFLPAVPLLALTVFNTGISLGTGIMSAGVDPFAASLVNIDELYRHEPESSPTRARIDYTNPGGGLPFGPTTLPESVEWTPEGEAFLSVAAQMLAERGPTIQAAVDAAPSDEIRAAVQSYADALEPLATATGDLIARFDLLQRDYHGQSEIPNHYPNTPRGFTAALKHAMEARGDISRAVQAAGYDAPAHTAAAEALAQADNAGGTDRAAPPATTQPPPAPRSNVPAASLVDSIAPEMVPSKGSVALLIVAGLALGSLMLGRAAR